MSILSVKIIPIDPLLFRDNRSARAGEDHLISAHGPSPFTIFGAIGAHIARKFGVKPDYSDWQAVVAPVLGEFISDLNSIPDEIAALWGYTYFDEARKTYFPRPLVFRITEVPKGSKSFYALPALQVTSQPGFSNCPFPEKYLQSSGKEEGEYEEYERPFSIDQELLESLLTWQAIDEEQRLEGVKLYPDLYEEEFRTGLQMVNAKNITEEGYLFNRPYWRFRADFSVDQREMQTAGIQAWFSVLQEPDDVEDWNSIGFVGGDRRRAHFEFTVLNDRPLLQLRDRVSAAVIGTNGFFACLLTPTLAFHKTAWPIIDEQQPVAAAIGKPLYMSGWMHSQQGQQPRPMQHLLPPGSTFFYEWPSDDPEQREEIIKKNWFTSISKGYEIFGFGRILMGVWT